MALSPAGVALGVALARDPRQSAALGLAGGLLGSGPAGLLLLMAIAGPAPRPSQQPSRRPEPAERPAPAAPRRSAGAGRPRREAARTTSR
jgi:hypothetical protein